MYSRIYSPLPSLNLDHVPVDQEEFARLLQMPGSSEFDDNTREIFQSLEQWHRQTIQPQHEKSLFPISKVEHASVLLENGVQLKTSIPFSKQLQKTEAHALIVLAFSLGPQIEERVNALWAEDKFDESYLLNAYGAGLAEAVRTQYGAGLCDWAENNGCALMPYDGPGYNGWPLNELHILNNLLISQFDSKDEKNEKDNKSDFQKNFRVLPSGMLNPVHSMIIVFGVTAHPELLGRKYDASPCSRCSYSPCQFRRAPHQKTESSDINTQTTRKTTKEDKDAQPSS